MHTKLAKPRRRPKGGLDPLESSDLDIKARAEPEQAKPASFEKEKNAKAERNCLIARLVLDNHSTGFVITSHETGLQLLTAAICQCHRHVLISR